MSALARPDETGAVLPSRPDAERSLLGALLTDGSLLGRVQKIVSVGDFASAAHGTIFDAMLALHGRNEGIDLVTVTDELEKPAERLARAGGAPYVSSLVDRIPDVENVKKYAGIVAEAGRNARLRRAALRLVEDVEAGRNPDDAVLGLARIAAPAGEAEADGPRVVSLADLCAVLDEPMSWLVEGVLSERGLGMLAAEAYMAKSTFIGALGLHLAAGRDFIGWQIPAPRPVLYWQTEGSVHRFKRRLEVAANYYGIDVAGLPFYMETSGIGEDFRTPAFREVAEKARGGLLIADTSGAFYFGDENSAEEVRAGWIRPLKAVAAACNVAVLTVHHHGKPSKEREGPAKGRGSSALFGDFDTWLRIEKVAGEPDHRTLYVDKVREAELPGAVELAFIGDRAAFDVVGPGRTGTVKTTEVDALAKRRADEGLVLSYIAAHAKSQAVGCDKADVESGVSAANGISRQRARDAVIRLRDSGGLEIHDGPKKADDAPGPAPKYLRQTSKNEGATE